MNKHCPERPRRLHGDPEGEWKSLDDSLESTVAVLQ